MGLESKTETRITEAFDEAFASAIRLLHAGHDAGYLNLYRLFPIVSMVLGNRVQVGNASRFIYHYAKSQGYDIPPYPLAGSGEIKKFFADEGVENLPTWYKKVGFTEREYEHAHEYTLVSVRGRNADRTAFLIDVYLRNWPQFVPLVESKIDTVLRGEVLARFLNAVMNAALDERQTDSKNPAIHLVRFEL